MGSIQEALCPVICESAFFFVSQPSTAVIEVIKKIQNAF